MPPLPATDGQPQAGPRAPAEVIPIASDPDRDLLQRHHGGERAAFAQLMKNYANPIYGYMSRSGVALGDRDDLFQEVFCKVHQASQKKMPTGPVRPWVFRIAVNTVRDHFRRTKVRAVVTLDAEPAKDEASSCSPEASAEAKQTAQFLEAEIQKLPLAQREALLLSSVAGLGIRDAASVLGEPAETVKTRVRRARAALAKAMSRRTLEVPS